MSVWRTCFGKSSGELRLLRRAGTGFSLSMIYGKTTLLPEKHSLADICIVVFRHSFSNIHSRYPIGDRIYVFVLRRAYYYYYGPVYLSNKTLAGRILLTIAYRNVAMCRSSRQAY